MQSGAMNTDADAQAENTAPGQAAKRLAVRSPSKAPTTGLSISKRLTALLAFLGSLVAVVVPATEAIQSSIQGSWQMEIKERELNHQIAMEYLKLAISNETKPADRQRVLKFLAAFMDGPLSNWAKSELADQQRQTDEKAKQMEQIKKTFQDEEGDAAKTDSDIYVMQIQLSDALSYNDMDKYWSLLSDFQKLLQTKHTQTAKIRAIVASTGSDLGANISALQDLGILARVDAVFVKAVLPGSTDDDIVKFLSPLKAALNEAAIRDAQLIAFTFGIIKVDAGTLRAVSEIGDGARYEGRQDLGNTQPGDGIKYIGRGFIQITGRAAYQRMSQILGLGDALIVNPEKALDPVIAARTVALFIKSKEVAIRAHLDAGDSAAAERVVEGGYSRLESFKQAYTTALARLTAK
jgi:predicted chitinase